MMKLFVILYFFCISTNVITKGSLVNLDYTDYIQHASNVFSSDQKEPFRCNMKSKGEEEQLLLQNTILKGKLIEGDIINEERHSHVSGRSLRKKRKIIVEIDPNTKQNNRWPNKTIPYQFTDDFSSMMRGRVMEAINHWHKFTCIKFEPYSPSKHKLFRSKVVFQPGNICGSTLGYKTDPYVFTVELPIYLGDNCGVGNIIHELGHTIGFRHEQSRVDRDAYVKINVDEVARDLSFQYEKMKDSEPGYYNVKYDLFSIMHYGASANVIESRDPRLGFLMGQRIGLSFLDIELANKAYHCQENCAEGLSCLNGGFLNKECECVCAEGLMGARCELVNSPTQNNKNEIHLDELGTGLDCDFDGGNLCQWSNDKTRAAETWVLNDPNDLGVTYGQSYFKTVDYRLLIGPQNGDPSGNKSGLYAYVNSFKKSSPNSNAILTSPVLKAAQATTVCLRFWYNMFGSASLAGYPIKIGNLSVGLKLSNGEIKRFWSRSDNQGIDWLSESVEVKVPAPAAAIFFEAKLLDWNYGDIAVDQIQLRKGPCLNSAPKAGDKIVSEWTDWSSCSAQCGQSGVRTRTRICFDDSMNEIECNEEHLESEKCEGAPCKTEASKASPPSDTWSQWSSWSDCLGSCQSPYRTRLRTCAKTGSCQGIPIEYQNCPNNCQKSRAGRLNAANSPENEELESWSEWSECSARCGWGQQIRRVVCLTLEQRCDLNKREVRECFVKEDSCTQKDVEENEKKHRFRKELIQEAQFENDKISHISHFYENFPNSIKECGGIFNVSADNKVTITSPSYPEQYPANIRCYYLIQSPENTRLQLKALDLDLQENPSSKTCMDGVELRYFHLGQPGPIFCGTITSSEQLSVNSYFNYTMLIFRSDWSQTKQRRGFKLEVSLF